MTWLENANGDVDLEIAVWDRWIDIFLESSIDVIRGKIPEADRADLNEKKLSNLLPWSNDALRGFSVFSYTEPLDQSLVQYVRDQLGKWTSDNMHTLLGGMHSLPNSFLGPNGLDAEADVEFNKPVSKISYLSISSKPNNDFVKVTCYFNNIEPESNYTARVSLSIT